MIREAFRLSREELPAGFDWVVIPRAAAPPPLNELSDALKRLSARVAERIEKEAR